MSNRIGGYSYNTNSPKKGVRSRHKCKHCNREYKMDWARDKHQRTCGLNPNKNKNG